MATIEHAIDSVMQPSNATCTQASAQMLLSYADRGLNSQKIYEEAPVFKNVDGIELGGSLLNVASWCAAQGLIAKVWTFDAMIIDLNWRKLSEEKVAERLRAVKDSRFVAALGKDLTRRYVDDYIEFVEIGGKLTIEPYVSSQFLDSLIAEGPFCAGVSLPTLRSGGHAKNTGTRQSVPDDTSNGIASHAVVIYGKTPENQYMIADPWGNPAKYTVNEEQLISAIMAAQWFCDNVIFQVSSRSER